MSSPPLPSVWRTKVLLVSCNLIPVRISQDENVDMTLHDPGRLLRAGLPSCEKFWSFVIDLNVNAGVLGTLPADVLVRSDIDAPASRVGVARLLPARVVGSLIVIAIVVSGFIVTPVLRRGPSAALHVRRQIAIGIRTARSQSVAIGCAVCI